MLEEKDFQRKADAAFEELKKRLLILGDEHGFDVEGEAGKLEVLFEEPEEVKFVISPNTPVREIWISALSTSFKLGWNDSRNAFVLERPVRISTLSSRASSRNSSASRCRYETLASNLVCLRFGYVCLIRRCGVGASSFGQRCREAGSVCFARSRWQGQLVSNCRGYEDSSRLPRQRAREVRRVSDRHGTEGAASRRF